MLEAVCSLVISVGFVREEGKFSFNNNRLVGYTLPQVANIKSVSDDFFLTEELSRTNNIML